MQLAATAASDLVVFITDGNPTVRNPNSNSDSSDTSGNVNQLDLAYGIASANLAKGANQKILAVGVGSGITDQQPQGDVGPEQLRHQPDQPRLRGDHRPDRPVDVPKDSSPTSSAARASTCAS